jgi:hypothetical protein
MDSKELKRLERMHLCANDDGKIYGLDAFVAAIEKAAREEAIRECMEERDRVKRDSFLVLAATVLAAGGRIAVDRDSMLKSIDTNLERVDNPDGTFEFRALLKEGS